MLIIDDFPRERLCSAGAYTDRTGGRGDRGRDWDRDREGVPVRRKDHQKLRFSVKNPLAIVEGMDAQTGEIQFRPQKAKE